MKGMLLVLMALVVVGPMAAALAWVICDHHGLSGKDCNNPGQCVNACAAKCPSLQSCYQCCVGFAPDPNAYNACRSYCDDVWTGGGG
jgi:hypothetical protein